MKKISFQVLLVIVSISSMLVINSCGSKREYLVIPHSVSTASAVTVENLNLQAGQYDVLRSITETASVICEYKGDQIKVTSGEGDFTYTFKFDSKSGWSLKKFSGAASLGYFTSDLNAHPSEVPNPEEFSRRVAMSRIIRAAKDYQADGVVEPVVISNVSNLGQNKIEYTSTVSAKLIVIKSNK